MLILSRRPGESVRIGDDVTVTVLGARGGQVRLGFTAPHNVAVHRQEVYERIQAEKSANVSHARSGTLSTATIHRWYGPVRFSRP